MSEESGTFIDYLSREDKVEVMAWSTWMSVYESSDLPKERIKEASVQYSKNVGKVLARYGVKPDQRSRVLLPVFTNEIWLRDEEAG